MKRTSIAIAFAALSFAVPSWAAGPDFDTLKKLAGDYQISLGGKVIGNANYRVTSAGSAVVETIFAGAPHEMVTVYTRDGDRIAVTHYCAGNNQPHLISKAAEGNKLAFDFVSVSNLKSPDDDHMHSLQLTFDGPDQVTHEWQDYAKGKPAGMKVFTLKRKA